MTMMSHWRTAKTKQILPASRPLVRGPPERSAGAHYSSFVVCLSVARKLFALVAWLAAIKPRQRRPPRKGKRERKSEGGGRGEREAWLADSLKHNGWMGRNNNGSASLVCGGGGAAEAAAVAGAA